MNPSDEHPHDEDVGALQSRLWNQGRLDEASPRAVTSLIDMLAKKRSARIALLLGLIAEGQADPETQQAARNAVKSGIPTYLALLSPHPRRRDPLFLALIYLLAHFHEQRARILEHLRKNGWDPRDDDLIRLERVLSFQEASRADVLEHMRRQMAVPITTTREEAWRKIVASILAPLGAEAADAILRYEAG